MNLVIKKVLAMLEEGEQFITRTTDVYVSGNRIAAIGAQPEGFVPEKTLDGRDRLLMPGLVNAHTHAYMTQFRNSADDLAFNDWLFGRIEPIEDHMTEEDNYWGTMLNIAEMYKSGTTSFIDMNIKSAAKGIYSGPAGAAPAAANDAGIRAVITRGLAGTADDPVSLTKFGQVLEEMEMYRDHDRVRIAFGPHAPYSCMADYLEKLVDYAKRYHVGLNIHLSESETEMANMAKEHGVTPIRYVADLGVFDVPAVAAHCVYATPDDMEIMRSHGVSVAINPKSNMKLGNGFAPVDRFLETGVNVCIGTDGCGSNNTQNLFAEMNTAALIYKGKEKKAQCVSAQDVLRFATVNGGRALTALAGRPEEQLGVIREGALADLILIDLDQPQFYPRNNVLSGMVYSAKGSEVETVIVNGEIVMEKGEILTMDMERVCYENQKIAERLGLSQ